MTFLDASAALPNEAHRSPHVTADDLVVLVAHGDQRAFSDLYDQTSPRVFGLVVQVLRDPAQAEEVTQEVYLELWQNAARFDGTRGKAIPFMLTMARRRAIDRVRASQSSRDRDIKIGIRDQPTAFDVVSETIDMQFANDEVREAMTHISALQRQVIELAYFGNLTQAEISARLDVKIPTIKSRMRDGLIALRRAMPAEAA